ncbi:MAG: DUF389 domain-containing protein [Chloroflexota bacterium]|nr:DUF389 domain-containing protein [Chloroflexota bacterium]
MSIPKTEQTPDDPKRLPPARRRRSKRLLVPLNADEQEAFLDDVAHRVSPSFDFFLFSLLAGLVISLGLWLGAPAILVLGALLAPMMAPIIGISLGTITGSTRFFIRNLGGFVIASVLVFLISMATGYISAFWEPLKLIQAYLHTQLAWHHFLVLAIGAVLTTLSLVRTKRRIAAASVALAYELYIPLAAAGFGLGSGNPQLLWPDGLVVFAVHLAWAAILGTITLLFLGFRPLTLFGYTIGGMTMLIGVLLLIGLSGAGIAVGGKVALPTPLPTATVSPSMTPSPTSTATLTTTPIPPTITPSLTLTPSQTLTPSDTPTPSPTPSYAIVDTPEEYGGAFLREAPGFSSETFTSVLNGTLIAILSKIPEEKDSVFWLQVRLPSGEEGWMMQSAITIATPVPNW